MKICQLLARDLYSLTIQKITHTYSCTHRSVDFSAVA